MIQNLDKIIREKEASLGRLKQPQSYSNTEIKELAQLVTQSHEHIMKSLKILNENQKELYDMMVKMASEK
jgi:hypothetical protein